MSTETEHDTPAPGTAGPSPGRERLLDAVGLVARLFLGAVLVYAGAVKVGHPLTAERAVQAYEIFPMDLAGWIGLALPFVEIVLGVLLAARPVHPARWRSSRRCSWWPSSSASPRPGPAA